MVSNQTEDGISLSKKCGVDQSTIWSKPRYTPESFEQNYGRNGASNNSFFGKYMAMIWAKNGIKNNTPNGIYG